MLALDKYTCFFKKFVSAKDKWDEFKSALKNYCVKFHVYHKAFDRRSETPNRIEINEEKSTNMRASNDSVFSDINDDTDTNDDVDAVKQTLENYVTYFSL